MLLIGLAVFQKTGSTSPWLIYEAISQDIAESFSSSLLELSTINYFSPSVTMRGGAGLARVYNSQSFTVRRGRFVWSPQDSINFPFHGPVTYTDNWTAYQQDIEYIGDDDYGIAYVSSDFRPWFDRGSLCCNTDGIRGDADGDCTFGCVTVGDLSYLVAYLFQGGPEPACVPEANADSDCTFGCVTVGDLSYLVAYLFQSGPAPGACP